MEEGGINRHFASNSCNRPLYCLAMQRATSLVIPHSISRAINLFTGSPPLHVFSRFPAVCTMIRACIFRASCVLKKCIKKTAEAVVVLNSLSLFFVRHSTSPPVAVHPLALQTNTATSCHSFHRRAVSALKQCMAM